MNVQFEMSVDGVQNGRFVGLECHRIDEWDCNASQASFLYTLRLQSLSKALYCMLVVG